MLHKFKKGLPLLAIVIGVALSAFTSTNPMNNQNDPTWTYVGPAIQTQNQLNDAGNFELGTTTCSGSGKICTIEAASDGNTPERPVLDQGDVDISNTAYSPTQKH